nr:3-hydroxyisobutyryl-CoA hydrolase-like protein 2, mitochondrial [Ipomoea batatas]
MEKTRKFLSKKLKAMDYSQLLVISLGSGSRNLENKYCAEVAAKWNILDWMVQIDTGIPTLISSPFINLVSYGMADMVDYHVSTIFQSLNVGENYLRIQDNALEGTIAAMDNASLENMIHLREIGENLLKQPVSKVDLNSGVYMRVLKDYTNEDILKNITVALPNGRSQICKNTVRSEEKLPKKRTQVLVEGRAKSRAAILNRPSALNSLTSSMVARLNRLYNSWEENSEIGFVVMKGSDQAFCSGADVVTLHQLINEGKVEECKIFFQTLYNFVYLLGTYLKPNVAILDGVTMGSGAGIALPGMFRVATDRTVYSSPESQIGFHPDGGASYYLPRLPGYLGEYLALTGEKLNGVEMIACGLATHYVLKEVSITLCASNIPEICYVLKHCTSDIRILQRLPWIEERLGKLMTDDRSVIESSLAQYGDLVYPDRRSMLHKFEMIDKCFSPDTVEEIIEALENEAAESYDEWCATTLKKIKAASPLSLKVTLNSIREGRFQSLDQCLAREYRISLNWISRQGVRARLIDKDFSPKWDPPRLEDATKDMVESFFAPLDEFESELNLPTSIREPSV